VTAYLVGIGFYFGEHSALKQPGVAPPRGRKGP
jgi:hypothetical protein